MRLISLTLFFICFLFFYCQKSIAMEVVDRIVAIVDGEIITLVDLNKRLAPYLEQFKGKELTDKDKMLIMKLKKKILDEMIDNILIKNLAKKYKIHVSDIEVKNYIDDFRKKNNLTLEELKNQLKMDGTTYAEFCEKVRDNILRHRVINGLVKRKVLVTDTEIKKYYEEHMQSYKQNKEVCLKIILVPSYKEAQKIYAEIKSNNIDFELAAKKYSIGPNSQDGGDLGCLRYVDLNSIWKNVLDNMQVGDISEPFEYEGKGVILKLVQVKKGSIEPLDKVKEKIRQKLYNQKFEKLFNDFMTNLRKKAVIEVKL